MNKAEAAEILGIIEKGRKILDALENWVCPREPKPKEVLVRVGDVVRHNTSRADYGTVIDIARGGAKVFKIMCFSGEVGHCTVSWRERFNPDTGEWEQATGVAR